jgi:hypothetical protein
MASSRGMFAGRGVMFVKSVCFGMSTKVRLQGRESCIHSRSFEYGVSDYVGGLLTEIRNKDGAGRRGKLFLRRRPDGELGIAVVDM